MRLLLVLALVGMVGCKHRQAVIRTPPPFFCCCEAPEKPGYSICFLVPPAGSGTFYMRYGAVIIDAQGKKWQLVK